MEALKPDELYCIAAFLRPRDLLALSLTSSHFGSPRVQEDFDYSSAAVRTPTKVTAWSLIEEAARQNIMATMSDEDREELEKEFDLNTVTAWLLVAHRLKILQDPLTFRALLGREDVTCIDGDFSHVMSNYPEWAGCEVVLCRQVMRSGSYYAVFTLTGDPDAYLEVGVLPARTLGWAPTGESDSFHLCYMEWCELLAGDPQLSESARSCFYSAYSGYDCCYSYDFEFSGMEERSWHNMDDCTKQGDEIGLLLDLERGTLSVEKNRWLLGIMREGLTGEYVWAARMCAMTNAPRTSSPPSVRIERGPIPEYTDDIKDMCDAI